MSTRLLLRLTGLMQVCLIVLLARSFAVGAVDEYTGSMQLQYELVKIREESVELSVSLDCLSGIKVNQRASWVGLGFGTDLPSIVRTPMGCVDEKSGQNVCIQPWVSIREYERLLKHNGNGYSAEPGQGDYTARQDVYMLNAGFASGRIVLVEEANSKDTLEPKLQNWRPLRIGYRIEWTVTDEDGRTHVFGQAVEASRLCWTKDYIRFGKDASWWTVGQKQVVTGDGYVNASFNVRWYMTEIREANYDPQTGKGDHISLTYTPGTQVDQSNMFSACIDFLTGPYQDGDLPLVDIFQSTDMAGG
jgi:hypothetical protein